MNLEDDLNVSHFSKTDVPSFTAIITSHCLVGGQWLSILKIQSLASVCVLSHGCLGVTGAVGGWL